MDIFETLTTRRSCKNFIKGKKVPDEILDRIVTAGTYAPTGKGMQSPFIVLVNDEKTVKKLSKLNATILGSDADPFYGAPTVAVVFADTKYFTYVYDGSLVMGNMLNEAHSLGVGACWIHRAKEMFRTEEGKALMREWGIPETCEGIGNCVLGYSEKEPSPSKPRKENYVIRV